MKVKGIKKPELSFNKVQALDGHGARNHYLLYQIIEKVKSKITSFYHKKTGLETCPFGFVSYGSLEQEKICLLSPLLPPLPARARGSNHFLATKGY